jgi:putative FmdB family regulatory protein
VPIYEYRCDACDRLSSVLVRSTRVAPSVMCEHCGGADLHRVMSRVQSPRVASDPGQATGGTRTAESWVQDRFREYGVDLPDGER